MLLANLSKTDAKARYSHVMRNSLRIGMVLTLTALGALGCAESPCEELALQCAGCPADGIAIFAKVSCETTAEAGDEEACQSRLEERQYENLGCVANEP